MADTTRQMREQTNSQIRLLRLPRELRDVIYELVLTNGVVDITDMSVVRFCTASKSSVTYGIPDYSDHTHDNQRFVPGMLQACRQLRQEASKIYYSTNAFLIRPQPGKALNRPKLAEDWLKMQQPGALTWIETILVLSYEECSTFKDCPLRVLVDLKTGDLKRLRCPQDKACCNKEYRTHSRADWVQLALESAKKQQGGIEWHNIMQVAKSWADDTASTEARLRLVINLPERATSL
ncbi:hypothetical protein PRZ48_009671 [Zasmidium cellare]|uniref:2EXR domain-containing protein n=1 Tax=Zasmidium cellare TaxID=395010 RepID=A0ABR0ECC4_ZASCE|nr:hypothetical protein PRZ48_009671 [Zasmidium cellare]